ncbi:MAG: DUF2066 domain-containing protein [Pseudomonadota bacterium]
MSRFAMVCIFIGLLALPSRAAWPVEMTDLYAAEVPVADQSAAARAAASRAALAEVLVKVTGSAAAPAQPQFKALLQQSAQAMQRYSYRTAESGQALQVSFDRQTINQRIYDAGLPVWDRNRPQILLWLALEDGGGRTLVGGENQPELQTVVKDRAQRRGLPVILPKLDGEEQNAVNIAGVWGQFSEPLMQIAARYPADAVLLGRVYAIGPERWRGQWTLRHAGSTASWEAGEGSIADVVAAGLNQVAENLAQRYALVLKPGVNSVATLMVDNVANIQDYARLSRYLDSLDPVRGVTVERVEGASVVYRVQVRGELQGLTQALVLGRVLTPVAAGAAADDALQYRLIP